MAGRTAKRLKNFGSIFSATSTVGLSERDNKETLLVKEEETNDADVHQNRVVFYAVFAFSLAIASSNCPEREFAAFNLRFDVIRVRRGKAVVSFKIK